jgi:LPS-assembly lipoprotein
MSWSDPGVRASVLALVLVTGLCAGCGFHLRGAIGYPPGMAVTYIEASDRYSPFYRRLKQSLQDSGVQVTTDPARAGAVVRIIEDQTGERVVSVSARNTPTEYEVYYVVRYALDIAGAQALPPKQLSLSRNYNYDETLVLGKATEAQVIRDALADDMVALVTRRLSAVE